MTSRVGRAVLIAVGVIAIVVGLIWMGQGANLIPGSFMTGDRTWLVIGLVVAAVGIALIALAFRRSRGPRS